MIEFFLCRNFLLGNREHFLKSIKLIHAESPGNGQWLFSHFTVAPVNCLGPRCVLEITGLLAIRLLLWNSLRSPWSPGQLASSGSPGLSIFLQKLERFRSLPRLSESPLARILGRPSLSFWFQSQGIESYAQTQFFLLASCFFISSISSFFFICCQLQSLHPHLCKGSELVTPRYAFMLCRLFLS